VLRLLDTVIAVTCLAAILVVLNLNDGAQHLTSFLETRVTIKNVILLSGIILGWPLVFAAFGLYRLDELMSFRTELGNIAKACAFGSSLVVPVALTSRSGAFGLLSVFLFLLTVTAVTAAARFSVRLMLRAGMNPGWGEEHVIIAGTGPRALEHYRQVAAQSSCTVLGFVDTMVVASPLGVLGPPFLGTIHDLERILVSRAVDAVHIGLPVKSCYAAIQQVIWICERVGVKSCYRADVFPRSLAHTKADIDNSVVAMNVAPDDYRLWIKRAIDVGGALIGLVLFSPIMLAASVAIWWTSPGRIIFRQERVGLQRRRIMIYKFRTMVADAESRQAALEQLNEADGPVFKIRHDPRLTPVGHFLRKTSIDELPQLLNVLKGEMSLVGPRPMAIRDVSRFEEASLMRRFSVMPGLTCLWQIRGRSNTNFERWIELDLEYIDRWSLSLDLAILAMTVPAVVKCEGAV
jgi:exopolysaccharide biosynthesis polyprenyl glycosylphosphotransferase